MCIADEVTGGKRHWLTRAGPACACQKRELDPTEVCCRPVRERLSASQRTVTHLISFSTPLATSTQYHLVHLNSTCAALGPLNSSTRIRPFNADEPPRRAPQIRFAAIRVASHLTSVAPPRQHRWRFLQRLPSLLTVSHEGVVRRDARNHVFAIAAKAMGDKRRRDQCLGWSVFATRGASVHHG